MFKTITFTLVLVALTGCSQRGDVDMTPAQRVDELFAFLTPGTQAGAAVMIIRDSEILHQGHYGFANIEQATAITSDTNFRLGSVSKQFAALAIMILNQDGLLSFDDPVSRYVPELAPYPGVTIRHLMQHTGGLPDYYDLIDTTNRVPTNKDAAALLGKMARPDFAPGDRYEYSNAGYDMLAPVVEGASGVPFVDFVRDRIFEPLHMQTTLSHDHTFPEIANRALGYDFVDGVFTENDYDPLNGIVGSGGIYSNLNDMYRWDQALYTDQIVSQELIAEAFTSGTNNQGEKLDYGFGWRIDETHGHKRVRHGGSWVGFRSHIARVPDLHFSIVILSNRSDFSPDDYIEAITDIYLGKADSE